jgi:ribosome biogenesis protein ERB1
MLLTADTVSSVVQKAGTEKIFETVTPGVAEDAKVQNVVEWIQPDEENFKLGYRLIIHWKDNQHPLKFITWHYKGDYFASVSPTASAKAVLIHQLSRRQSQNPFKKSKGFIQCVKFHPSKPYFFVASQTHIRVYNLAQQVLSKKLQAGAKWVSCMHIHPGGDNLILGSYDRRVCWFDLDLSPRPYKVLKYHKLAIRQTAFHSKYPLFASCSDDGHTHIFHGMVYNDLLQNPFIVPLKILKGHQVVDDLGVLDIVFHPSQPWIFTAGADKTIKLFT